MPVRRQPLRLLAPLTKKDIEAKKKARRLHLLLLTQHLCWFYLTKALQEVKAREGGPAPSRRPRKDIAANHTFLVISASMRCCSLVNLEFFNRVYLMFCCLGNMYRTYFVRLLEFHAYFMTRRILRDSRSYMHVVYRRQLVSFIPSQLLRRSASKKSICHCSSRRSCLLLYLELERWLHI